MDTQNVRKDFPLLQNEPELVYLDSTATSLKPQIVIDKNVEYYSKYSANIFRGVYKISERATQEYEETRGIVASLIHAESPDEIIFTRNATESLNLVAYSLGRKIIEKGDEIVTTIMEHHSNFVPWQVLCQEVGASFKVINVNEQGQLDIFNDKVKSPASPAKPASQGERGEQNINLNNIITKKTKIFALTYVSNVLGTINPIKEIIKAARLINPNIIIVIDGAQAVPHMAVNVQDLDCDFFAFSSHKMLGPTGIGVLWGRKKLLNDMYPFLYGGEMIQEVYVDRTVFKEPPLKFEAGTPHIAGVIAFKEAIRYLQKIGFDAIRKHEMEITTNAVERLIDAFGKRIRILGPSNIESKGGIVAFELIGNHAHDVAQILDEENVAVRAGNHCAMPLHTFYNIQATTRASFYIYNDKKDVDKLIAGLKKVVKILG